MGRRGLGLTQGELAARAGVSLATIQAMEAGRANPALGTMERILGVLGMELCVEVAGVDWDMLAALGVPISGAKRGGDIAPTKQLLLKHLRRALAHVGSGRALRDGDQRKAEALAATMLAFRRHFPTLYEKHFGRSTEVEELVQGLMSGRTIKLTRMATSRLAEYL